MMRFFVLGILGLAGQVFGMAVTSPAPGNLFPVGKPANFTVKDTKGQVTYEVVDYFGKRIGNGKGPAIQLQGLLPGWYELCVKDNAGTVKTALGVLLDRKGLPLPMDGRVCVDGIGNGSGLTGIIRMAGFPWVRDRLWWNAIQYGQGPIEWKNYPRVAEIYAREGIFVCQVLEDSPSWLHPKTPNGVIPDDLRDIYKFYQAISAKLSNGFQAWEVGNEPDIAWGGHADRFAGYVKAGYLGLKDGNPKALVLQGSMCWGLTNFAEVIYASGLGQYSDIFNWHFYGEAEQYAWQMEAFLEMLKRNGAESRPVWISSCGTAQPQTGENNMMDPKSRRKQAYRTIQNVISAMAAGVDKYFIFSMPHYEERNMEFSLLRPDGSPYPGFVAYSTAANILGESAFLGRWECPGVTAMAFTTPKGNVLALWSNEKNQVTIPTEKKTVQVANIFGQTRDEPAADGKIKITVGPEAVYVLEVSDAVRSKLTGTVRPKGVLPHNLPSRIVVMGYPDLPVDGWTSLHGLTKNTPFNYTVEVYNFDSQKTAEGSVDISLPIGWKSDRLNQTVKLEPMGRQILVFKLTPALPTGVESLTGKIMARGKFTGQTVPPSISLYKFDPEVLPVVERIPLDLGNPDRWKPDDRSAENETATYITVKTSAAGKNWLRFEAPARKDTTGPADTFSYSIYTFDKPMDLSKADALAVTVKEVSKAGGIRLMIVEESGAHYFTTLGCEPQKKRYLFTLRDLPWGAWFTGDPNHHFDLNKIKAIKIGREGSDFTFEAGDFELIKFPKKNERAR
jgi:hypothetical protein